MSLSAPAKSRRNLHRFSKCRFEGVNRFVDRWRFGYQSTGSSRHDRVCNEYVAGKELLQMQDGGEVAFCRG